MAGMDTDMDSPSNSSIMKRLEEGKQLPWRLVKHNTWMMLANKLDLPSPVSNNDWRRLAELLGFSTENILVLGNSKERSTIALFTHYLPKKNASVNSVAKALKQMNRDDALQILLDAVPDIDAEAHNSSMDAVEADDPCMAQGGCGCLGPSSLPCNRHHGAVACSPCHSHPHHHQHAQCLVASGGCCCHHMGSVHCHNSSVTCSPHVHAHPHTSRASPLTRGCGAVGGGGMHSMASQNYNITTNEVSFTSQASGIGGRDFYGIPSPPQQIVGHPHLHPSPMQQYPDVSQPSLSRVMPESMVVHQEMDSPNHRNFRSLVSDNGSMEVDENRNEQPALLHTAIARGQGMVSMSAINARAFPMEVPDMGDDTPSTSLEELSSSDSGSRMSSRPQEVMRQVSEECNAKQPNIPMVNSTKARGAYGNGDGPGSGTAWGGEQRGVTANCQRNTAIGGHANNYNNKEGQSSLRQLMELSEMPSRFKPDSKYTTVVAEQQIEEVGSNQRGNKVHIKRERDSSHSCQLSGSASLRGSSGTSSKSKGAMGADTYPLRIKPQAGGATVDQVRNRQPGTLTKTTSVPIDMKVEEFKKAFRHIKVFVTYAKDSKHHCRQVLSLCNCLDRNGFSCCADVTSLDVNSRDVSDQTTRDWCGRKFNEADFVLVCISALYLQEIKGCEAASPKPTSSSNKPGKGSLHAAYIYQLMQEEFQTTKRCSRFVPLYMDESLCNPGPSWLTKHMSYHWPRQYKDLLWMLTKPEERIKQRSKLSPQKDHNMRRVNGHHDS